MGLVLHAASCQAPLPRMPPPHLLRTVDGLQVHPHSALLRVPVPPSEAGHLSGMGLAAHSLPKGRRCAHATSGAALRYQGESVTSKWYKGAQFSCLRRHSGQACPGLAKHKGWPRESDTCQVLVLDPNGCLVQGLLLCGGGWKGRRRRGIQLGDPAVPQARVRAVLLAQTHTEENCAARKPGWWFCRADACSTMIASIQHPWHSRWVVTVQSEVAYLRAKAGRWQRVGMME